MALPDKSWEVVDQQPAGKAAAAARAKAASTANGSGHRGAQTPLSLTLAMEMPPSLDEMVESILAGQTQLGEQIAALGADVKALAAAITKPPEQHDSQLAKGLAASHKEMQDRIAALEKAITAPRIITLERGKDGLATSAVSRIGKTA